MRIKENKIIPYAEIENEYTDLFDELALFTADAE